MWLDIYFPGRTTHTNHLFKWKTDSVSEIESLWIRVFHRGEHPRTADIGRPFVFWESSSLRNINYSSYR